MKDSIVGLVDRQEPPNRLWKERGVKAFVLKVRWKDLQPDPFGPLLTSEIDDAIQECEDPSSPMGGLVLKLRVLAGVDSPDWVTRIAGGIAWRNPKDAISTVDGGLVPRWWDSAFLYAYDELQRRLATVYDSIDVVRSVAVSGASTLYDELMARQFSDSPDNLHWAMRAGYSYDEDTYAIREVCGSHQRWWKETHSSVAVQPVSWGLFGDPSPTDPADFWQSLTEGTPRLVIGNHSLSTPKIHNLDWKPFYDWLRALPRLYAPYPGVTTYIQTDAMSRIGNVSEVMQFARDLGVKYIELPKGYMKWNPEWFGDWLVK